MIEFIIFIIIGAFCILGYMLPGIIATKRKHNNSSAIVMLNVCFGWTFLGWVVALVWAFTKDVKGVSA